MEAGQRSDALEETCSRLEEEKYEVERRLVAAQDSVAKLEARRQQAEGEMARLTAALHKVRRSQVWNG